MFALLSVPSEASGSFPNQADTLGGRVDWKLSQPRNETPPINALSMRIF